MTSVATTDQRLPTADGPMRVYEALPKGTARGALIVIQEAFGVNDYIEDITRRAAGEGYHAVAPDMLHRAGGGTAAYDDGDRVMSLFASVTDEGILADLDASIDHLHAAGYADAQIGIVGFCFGGRVAFLAATRHRLGAAVTYYGGGIVSKGMPQFEPLLDHVSALQTPWMGHFGDLDRRIPVEDVERLRAELDAAKPGPYEIHRYEADHGFHCDGRPAVFNADAAQASWVRSLAWLDRHLARA